MNERIKQLAEQTIGANPKYAVAMIIASPELDKFAELLLRDVMCNMTEKGKQSICEDYGLEYKPTMLKNPSYGDLIPAEEWQKCMEFYAFIPDDGNGYWATEKEHSHYSCWGEKPSWATHVLWFNK
jgi:hypothetical protein